MPTSFGSTPIGSAYFGSTPIAEMYLGGTLVWTSKKPFTLVTTNTTVTAPKAGQIEIVVIGGGGGGAGSLNKSGGVGSGGWAGKYADAAWQVTAGQSISFTIGQGGKGGSSGSNSGRAAGSATSASTTGASISGAGGVTTPNRVANGEVPDPVTLYETVFNDISVNPYGKGGNGGIYGSGGLPGSVAGDTGVSGAAWYRFR